MVGKRARAHPRRVFSTTVTYTNGMTETGGGAKAVCINISRSGVCLYTYHRHEEGARINFLSGSPFNLEGPATVRWVRKINENLYRVGCEFHELKAL